MADSTRQAGRHIQLRTPLGDQDALLPTRCEVTERISGLFSIQLDLLADLPKAGQITAQALIGKPLTVSIAGPGGSGRRFFNGIVSRFSEHGRDHRFQYFRAEVVPWLWLLTLTSDCRIFQNKSVPDILDEVFDDLKGKFPDVVKVRKTSPTVNHPKIDFCVQYRETDFNFVSRLMEQEGMFYFFRHADGEHTLVLADGPGAHDPFPGRPSERYLPEGGTGEDAQTVNSFVVGHAMRPGTFALRDHHFQDPAEAKDVTRPTVHALGRNEKLEIYDAPGDYGHLFDHSLRSGEIEPEGRKLVSLRMEEEEAQHRLVQGTSLCPSLAAGNRFELKDFPAKGASAGPFVLSSVWHYAVQSPDYVSDQSVSGPQYHNAFAGLPLEIPFRPSRVTPRPVMQGPQSAIVAGLKDEEILTDKFGRVLVRFLWDREGEKKAERRSGFIRVAQPWAGTQWGAFFYPRVGQEVLVDFLEGNPDNPIIVGSVYNGTHVVPYALPEHQSRSGIKTRSTPEGEADNFNELRFEDKKDHEEIYFHAERDFSRVVENNDKLKVGFDKKSPGNQTVDIHGSQIVSVGADQVTTVGHDRKTTVKKGNREVTIEMGNDSLQIKMGNQTTKLDLGKSETEALQSIELKVGASSVKVDQTGVTIKGLIVKVEGTVMTQVKGLMTQVNGDAMLQARGGITMIN